jgi:hypothetical protein
MCTNGNDSVNIKALLFSIPFPYTIGAEGIPVMFLLDLDYGSVRVNANRVLTNQSI